MVDHIEYWLEVYTDRLKVDAKYDSEDEDYIKAVSYTHLTLPTNREV